MRMPRLAVPALLLAVVLAPPAAAQERNRVLELNAVALTNDYVSLSDKAGIGTGPALTIEAWVYPTSYAGFPTIVGNDYSSSYWFGLDTSGRPRFYPRGGSYVQAPAPIPLNAWTHLAAAYDGTQARIMVNGELALFSTAITGPIGTSAGDLRIGADRSESAAAHHWRGYLDEVRIWNTMRTDGEIDEMRFVGAASDRALTPAYAGLRSYWDFEVGTSSLTEDVYTPSRTGALMGTASYATSLSPPVAYNVGVQFGGVDDWWEGAPLSGFESGVTLMAWIAPFGTGTHRAIVAKDFRTSFYLGLDPDGYLRFYPTGGIGRYVQSRTRIRTHLWTHVAATYANGVACLYVNGERDAVWTTISGPVGENSADVHIGADRSGTAPAYFFDGLIDEVRVVRGEMTRTAILRELHRGGANGGFGYVDEHGTLIAGRAYPMDAHTDGVLHGSAGRLVRSGAALWDTEAALWGDVDGTRFNTASTLSATNLPDPFEVVASLPLTMDQPGVVLDVDCFVVATSSYNPHLEVSLTSPAGTEVQLLRFGDADGRDLVTCFDDEAAGLVAGPGSPFVDGGRPWESLAAFDGEPIAGDWRLTLLGFPFEFGGQCRLALHSWGLRFNDVNALGVPGPAPAALSLRHAGANPVRAQGALVFELPRPGEVDLAVFDAQGRRVRELFAGMRAAGTHHVGWSAAGLEAGVYFVRLRVGTMGERSLRVSVVR